ncbi:rCG57384 [Rattus norvegicus]|uniref:RCG57384 n=1 Tax=Rattus norvegicus TaxID=10116 RepID=A6JPE3_RAT|nr:rCG57384 [Rattus norvegicus]
MRLFSRHHLSSPTASRLHLLKTTAVFPRQLNQGLSEVKSLESSTSRN